MAYRVIDGNGVAYSDNGGRRVLQRGNVLPDSLIERGFFTKGCIELLLNSGRIEEITEKRFLSDSIETPTFKSPSNKKAVISGKKGARKK